jgi:dolichol-phosphate mannosyltransferase
MNATERVERRRAPAHATATWSQLARFGVVGASGYLINLCVFAVLVNGLAVHHALAAVAAFCVAVSNNFVWNRYWTFGPGEDRVVSQAARFLLVSLASLMINLAALELLIGEADLSKLAAQAIAVALAMPFNFQGNRLWTFAER